jgi:membrane protease YdiL (CAAX protease family)
MIEAFSEEVIPKDVTSSWLFLFLAIMPGVFEEIAFRGVLLQGLRKRLRPVAVVLVVGAVFGLFHMALFRFAPTFALGVCLATVTLLTRSIYPAMLWHALNNGLGVWTAQNHILLGELEPEYYLPGVAALAVSFWILWRNRVPQSEPPDSKKSG